MKLPFFKSRASDAPAGSTPVANILVSQSAYDSRDPSTIVAQNAAFVNGLLTQGAYLRDELPADAMRSYHVDYYLAQVSNGGHGQLVGNSRWQPFIVKDIAEGLEAMRAQPFDVIFRDLCRLMASDSARAERIAKSGGFGEKDPAIAELDERYFAQDAHKIITPANDRWLRSLPELKVVPNAEYAAALQTLCNANPDRAARLAAREREGMAARLVDPVRVATRLLCMKANCLPILAFGGGDPVAIAPDGRQGVGWQIQSRAGRQIVFLFNDFAYLCETYLVDGRKLTPELMAEQRQHLLSRDLTGLEAFSKLSHKEIARIPGAHVAGAIEAAKQMPIIRFAELLCAKMKPATNFRDVYAATLHNSGQFLWLMETESSIGLFGFNNDNLVLFDLQMKPLAMISREDVAATQRATKL